MAFCLPTTYFTSALFPSPVVGSVGFVLGTDSGWIFSSFLVCYQWWPTIIYLNFRRISMKGTDTPHGDSPFLFVRPVHCKLVLTVVPQVKSLCVQDFPRIIPAWKPMQTFFLSSVLICGSKEVLICLSYPTLVHLLHFSWPPIMQEVSAHWAHLPPHWATEPFCTTQQ